MEVNSIHAYDSLAGGYNEQVGSNGGDVVRAAIHWLLEPYLAVSGTVLDFGGGTGLDLEWLARGNRTVYFCEPSAKMRSFAKKKAEVLGGNISFMQDCDFRTWKAALFADAHIDFCLADFAVVNSIVDLELFFVKMGLAIKTGGTLALVMLDEFPGNERFLRWIRVFWDKFRIRSLKRSYVLDGPVHKPVIHTRRQIRLSASPHFSSVKEVDVKNSMFRAYLFQKN